MSESTRTIVQVKFNGDEISLDKLRDLRAPLPGETRRNPYGRNYLCLEEHFHSSDNTPYKYSYTVIGKTEDVNFTWASSEYLLEFYVPVVGLYADVNTSVRYVAEDPSGNIFEFLYSYSPLDSSLFENHLLKININVINSEGANATLGNGWLFSGSYMDAYDKNGDIRVAGLSPDAQGQFSMKIHNGCLYIPTEATFFYYSEHYDKVNLLGKQLGRIDAPEGFGFHHDITWDNDGFLYCLGTPMAQHDPDNMNEGIIYKYVDETGELVAEIDYAPWYVGAMIGLDGDPHDCHFNSLDYVPEIDQLIVNSRNSSNYIGVDKFSLLPIWNVQSPQFDPLLLDEKINLTVVNPDKHIYISGAHTVFPSYNEKYLSFWSEGKVVLSIFDNVACKDENGNFLTRPIYDPNYDLEAGYPWDAGLSVVGIDLNNRTVEQLDYFTIPGQRSRITSNVFDSRDRRYFYFHVGVPSNFFVMNNNGEVVLEALDLFPPNIPVGADYTYRAIIFSFHQIRELIDQHSVLNLVRYDDTDERITYTGNWARVSGPNYYGGSQHYTYRLNDEVRFQFEGTAFNIIAATRPQGNPDQGLDIMVDGTLIGTCSFYSDGYAYQQIVFQSPELESGVHAVQLRANSGGNAYLDAIDIRGDLL